MKFCTFVIRLMNIYFLQRYTNEEHWITIGLFLIELQPLKKGGNMKQEDDNFEMKDEYDFSNGIRGRFYRPNKVSMTIRIDDDILIKKKP